MPALIAGMLSAASAMGLPQLQKLGLTARKHVLHVLVVVTKGTPGS